MYRLVSCCVSYGPMKVGLGISHRIDERVDGGREKAFPQNTGLLLNEILLRVMRLIILHYIALEKIEVQIHCKLPSGLGVAIVWILKDDRLGL